MLSFETGPGLDGEGEIMRELWGDVEVTGGGEMGDFRRHRVTINGTYTSPLGISAPLFHL
jgi:hypothetical protein